MKIEKSNRVSKKWYYKNEIKQKHKNRIKRKIGYIDIINVDRE